MSLSEQIKRISSHHEEEIGLLILLLFGLLIVLLCSLLIKCIVRNLRDCFGSRAANGQQCAKDANKSKQDKQGPLHHPIQFISSGKVLDGLRDGLAAHLPGRAKPANGDDGDRSHLTLNMEHQPADAASAHGAPLADVRGVGRFARSWYRKTKRLKGAKKLGRLQYRLAYNFNDSTFSVTILQAQDLPAMDLNGYSDPYVKVWMKPKRDFEKTSVQKRTLNPVFNETFYYRLTYGELLTRTLVMIVYDYDRFSKHDEIGQVSVPIGSIDLSQTDDEWAELSRPNEAANDQLGELCISLRYSPTSSKLTVLVMEARKLKKMDVGGLSDPYVKLALILDGKRIKKKRSTIKKCTLNPHYNESFTFELDEGLIHKVQLALTVVDYDRIGLSEPIGRIVLGNENASGYQEQRHWLDMLACPRRPVASWHALKDLDSSEWRPSSSMSSSTTQ